MSDVPGNGQGDAGAGGAGRLIAGRYRLLGPLGEGGMGVVWRARDELLGREIAVKEVRAPAALGAVDERRLYARLEREAWAAARVSHRNVVTVHDVAMQDGRPWIVMELVRGLALSDVLEAEGPLPPRRAAHIGAEVLAALRAAHAAGVLHRDVKPGNVLIANDGRVVLTDFGIATVEGSTQLTMTGELVGSPEFLAPERALGREPGPESDLWSLGVLLYAAVEGSSPFRQNTLLGTLRAVVEQELPPPRWAGELTPVLVGLLRKDPAERMPAEEAERRLREVGAGGSARTESPPTPATPPGPGASYSPTVAASGTGPAAASLPDPVTVGAATTAAGAAAPDRSRRATRALAAAAAVLLLVIGGTAWALLSAGDGKDEGGTASEGGSSLPPASQSTNGANGTDSTDGTGGAGSGETAPGGGAGADGGTSYGNGDGDGDGNGGGGGNGGNGENGHGGTTDMPAQSVDVHAAAVRADYTGPCPPPREQAPHFQATITVGRTPAEVEYRWVTDSGTSTGMGRPTPWKSLVFAEGGPKRQYVNHTELTHRQGETHRDRIAVEVRSPVRARSAWVGFWVACEQKETPTGEPSYSADGGSPAAGGE
ncbi:serine/threonine-protein kinase [Streptomyces sp. HNM0663]|uniref:non-specific serine/threonine protein kinase n=1 Tax=Streptomyces chengmaiensis TaxID=3040919 RepID=A0ABT6HRX0_9ACTN|nr:serine/threonine-protein kinase [Streptomyces chengmaiensis]MDH2391467.1 serine/threonine-protein kinase [Streptomyces chengmaiensis]